MFICEHWLQHCEIPTINSFFKQNGFIPHLKSSIDPEEALCGRPYGGIGFICKNIAGVSYKFVDIANDRISLLKVFQSGSDKLLLNVIGVYLPYHNGYADQITLYSDTLDNLQAIVDDCSGAPYLIVGDMNAALPKHMQLPRNWYRCRPFNHHSLLLHDFMTNNLMCAADLEFSQKVNYTYAKGGYTSHIDHVILPKYLLPNVQNCIIIPHNEERMSDHLPVRTTLNLQIDVSIIHEQNGAEEMQNLTYCKSLPRINWEDNKLKHLYSLATANLLPMVGQHLHCLDNIKDANEAQLAVDKGCLEITNALHKASETFSTPKSPCNRKSKSVPWWTNDCSSARDRMRFWRKLWIQSGQCRVGHTFEVYKWTKKLYRRARHSAVQNLITSKFNTLTKLFKSGNSKKFWNGIRDSKNKFIPSGHVKIDSLRDFFMGKFSENAEDHPEYVRHAKSEVQQRYNSMKNCISPISPFTPKRVIGLIKKLKCGKSAGADGITAEHLKYADTPNLALCLTLLLNCCVKFGIVPSTFTKGLLVPILKSSSLDATQPKNYRPIIISCIFSKVLEYAMLEDSSDHAFHPLQYGFVDGRSTKMAACTTQDLITYCNNRGSPVFACGLDVEKAFDGVPHCILLSKSAGIVKDHWWRMLYAWYQTSTAAVKLQGKISRPFHMSIGTRQGGLTSPFLFNIVYQDLISELSHTTGGIRINKDSFNVSCYADDLLLTSLTVTGLQKLIDTANAYVNKHGISFNANKSFCAILGKDHFLVPPKWKINDQIIRTENEINHLGVTISSNSRQHLQKRISQCRKAFYSLQAAGMCENGVTPQLKSYLWKSALQPILLYGNDCLPLHKSDIKEAESLQAKLIKAFIGLSKYLRTSPLLHALGVNRMRVLTDIHSVKLFRSIMFNDSQSKNLYTYFLRSGFGGNTLLNRVRSLCAESGFRSIITVLFNDKYVDNVIKSHKSHPNNNGIIDSCKMLLRTYSSSDRELLRLLLYPF